MLTLRLRPSFTIPELYLTGAVEEIEEALTVGALIQQTVVTTRSKEDMQRVMTEKTAEIERIRTGYQDRLGRIEGELARARESAEALQAEIAERVKLAAPAQMAIPRARPEFVALLRHLDCLDQ